MKRLWNSRRAQWINAMAALALSVFVAHGAGAAAPPIDEGELTSAGFKVLVATTSAQKDWVKRMAPGQIRAMQRNGKKFFLYPDASRDQVYVGGPNEYEAYRQLHPETKLAGQDSAKKAAQYRAKQDDAMKKATARDLSDPYYGLSWPDLGW
jgi:hypothetical protein